MFSRKSLQNSNKMSKKEINPKSNPELISGQNLIQKHGQTKFVHATQSRKGTLGQRDLTSEIPGPDRRADRTRIGRNQVRSVYPPGKPFGREVNSCLPVGKESA